MIRADFQSRIWDWCVEVFGEDIALNKRIRNFRFFEEAAELVQSLGMTQEEAHKLVDYVYGRPVGVPHQEMGGTVVTLYALANANGIKVGDAGWDEFNRCCQPEVIEKIRAKQKNKPNPEDVLPAVVEGTITAHFESSEVRDAWVKGQRELPKMNSMTQMRTIWNEVDLSPRGNGRFAHTSDRQVPMPLGWFTRMAAAMGKVELEYQHAVISKEFNEKFLRAPLGKPAEDDPVLKTSAVGEPLQIKRLSTLVVRNGIAYSGLDGMSLGPVGDGCMPVDFLGEEPEDSPAFHLNKNGDVAVADDYCYETDMSKCPKGAKVILLGAGGVATLGNYDGDEFWVGWAALPKVKK